MDITRRKFLGLFKVSGLSLVCSAVPVSFEAAVGFSSLSGIAKAHAKDGDDDSDNSGSGSSNSGSGRDDDDDDDDDSGRGRGRGRGGDDDDDRSVGNSGSSSGGSSRRLGNQYDMTIRYSTGWQESIRNGRYTLLDPKGRRVTRRQARMEDVVRMREAVK